VFCAALIVLSDPAHTLASSRASVFDLAIGRQAETLPNSPIFTRFACGTAGGPPGRPVESFSNFGDCPPDSDGLREVEFEYDDSEEKAARAQGNVAASWGLGTSYDFFPIITSALFDEAGVLEGLRIVTDPRPGQRKNDPYLRLRPRSEHYLLQLYLMDKFGMGAFDCIELPLRKGETSVLGMKVNRVCDRTDTEHHLKYHIEARFYRRAGQTDVDPDTGLMTEGQFTSETRAEIRSTAG
jgi:hypothetical protein